MTSINSNTDVDSNKVQINSGISSEDGNVLKESQRESSILSTVGVALSSAVSSFPKGVTNDGVVLDWRRCDQEGLRQCVAGRGRLEGGFESHFDELTRQRR